MIAELRNTEIDVQGLVQLLDLPQSTVSQHLTILRTRNLVKRRRNGRRIFYSLTQPWIARWLFEGIKLLETDEALAPELKKAATRVRLLWQGH